jgi:hypothetical protein
MSTLSSVTIPRELIDDLDDAAVDLFDTDAVPHRVTIERLLADHEAVDYHGNDSDA